MEEPMSKPPTVTTSQLLLRAPEPSDVEPLFEIQGDTDAMRYTYSAPSPEATADYLARYAARFDEDGFAPWTAVLRSEDRVVGWGGLNRDPVQPHWGVEVAYFIHPGYWRRGLAGEIVTASLELASKLGLREVLAFTRPTNIASRAVLFKTGFRYVRYVPEIERDQYVVDCTGYLTRAP
jgi:[ribosomal protein S5]-alanine N-acetyltransferase